MANMSKKIFEIMTRNDLGIRGTDFNSFVSLWNERGEGVELTDTDKGVMVRLDSTWDFCEDKKFYDPYLAMIYVKELLKV